MASPNHNPKLPILSISYPSRFRPPYAEFIAKYPNTPQALLAKAEGEVMLFAEACRKNTYAAYLSFVTSYPNAPQVGAAVNLAAKARLAEEKAALAKIEAQVAEIGDEAARDRARIEKVQERLADAQVDFAWESLQAYNILNSPELSMQDRIARSMGSCLQVKAMVDTFLLDPTYPNYAKSSEIIRKTWNQIKDDKHHNDIIDQLDKIRIELARFHIELCQVLEKEFEATRTTMRDGFLQLSGDVQGATAAINASSERIEAQIKQVNVGLTKTNQLLTRVVETQEKANRNLVDIKQSLNVVNKNLQGIRQEVKDLSVNLGTKLDILGTKINMTNAELGDLKGEVRSGFQRQSQLQQEMIDRLDSLGDSGFPGLGQLWQKGSVAIGHATSWVKDQGGKIASGTKDAGKKLSDGAKKLFGAILPGKIDAYAFESQGRLSFNLLTGSYEGTFELIPGVYLASQSYHLTCLLLDFSLTSIRSSCWDAH